MTFVAFFVVVCLSSFVTTIEAGQIHAIISFITFTFVLSVKDQAPHFVARLENKSAVSGERIILQCEVTGSPLPLICWRKDGRLVQTSSNCVQSFYGGVARLEIMQASAQDSACYECVASNPVSELSCQCHVQVVQQSNHICYYLCAPSYHFISKYLWMFLLH